MPELPEVETVVRGMRPVLEGKTLIVLKHVVIRFDGLFLTILSTV